MTDTTLVTIPNVHLCSTGTWEASTGTFVCTAEILAAVVEAAGDPGIRTPVVKLGHVDKRFDGEPAVGRIINMRVTDDGQELYGDVTGVPGWLAAIWGSAFPSRSVEIWQNYTGATGHVHDAVLTACALLGVSVPAIESLDDIKALYDDEAMAEYVAATKANESSATRLLLLGKVEPMATPAPPKGKLRARILGWLGVAQTTQHHMLAVNVSDVYAEFYEALPAGSWAWIREVYVGADAFVIVDDDDGDLWKIPYTEDADGDVAFGTPERVAVQYVPAPTDNEADDTMIMLARFGGSKKSLVKLTSEDTPDKPIGGRVMETPEVLALLGLPEDATDEQVTEAKAKVTAALTPTEPTPTPVPAPGDPVPTEPPPTADTADGTVRVDAETAGVLVAAARELRDNKRDGLLDGAIKAGKIELSRRPFWLAKYEADPEGTTATLDSLAALIPVANRAAGHAGNPEADPGDDAVWNAFASQSAHYIESEVKS